MQSLLERPCEIKVDSPELSDSRRIEKPRTITLSYALISVLQLPCLFTNNDVNIVNCSLLL